MVLELTDDEVLLLVHVLEEWESEGFTVEAFGNVPPRLALVRSLLTLLQEAGE